MVRSGTERGSSRANVHRSRGVSRSRPGAQLFDPAQVAQIQRARILAAMFDVATERGAANVSVADVVERSGVSRRTFYEIFSDCEDCFLAAFEDALASVAECVLAAYQAENGWRERIRAGLLALLAFLDEEPTVGRLLIVESLSGGPQALALRTHTLAQVAASIEQGAGESAGGCPLPSLTAEGLVGGVLAMLHARIIARPQTGDPCHEPLAGLINELMSIIVLPYQGVAAARRELERPVRKLATGQHDTRLLSDPFKEAGMRLTYRTVLVLLAVEEHPAVSNRQIGGIAGITDQGQISKLLGRLQRIGLIENTVIGSGQGVPNAWSLTVKGRKLARSIHTHTGTPHEEVRSKGAPKGRGIGGQVPALRAK